MVVARLSCCGVIRPTSSLSSLHLQRTQKTGICVPSYTQPTRRAASVSDAHQSTLGPRKLLRRSRCLLWTPKDLLANWSPTQEVKLRAAIDEAKRVELYDDSPYPWAAVAFVMLMSAAYTIFKVTDALESRLLAEFACAVRPPQRWFYEVPWDEAGIAAAYARFVTQVEGKVVVHYPSFVESPSVDDSVTAPGTFQQHRDRALTVAHEAEELEEYEEQEVQSSAVCSPHELRTTALQRPSRGCFERVLAVRYWGTLVGCATYAAVPLTMLPFVFSRRQRVLLAQAVTRRNRTAIAWIFLALIAPPSCYITVGEGDGFANMFATSAEVAARLSPRLDR
eukprot:TRINITY_DN11821_c0_g1_i1.p1 TRINITY_DN11821_c0_g1~~TRINITY_DN11821_c0_g1_i1.p1  ORF type:complete len:337 (-),score=44.35 TRINITY_DN11821_c0_g1_i1:3-1013(-)